ncbi:MAG: hypothetical protein LC713_01310 [Actinobacteria bacterium]|nr:hypothetical protein [Actinomycetota bacterium]
MTSNQHAALRRLEGRMVHVALAGGSRLDDVELVSARRRTCWVFVNGEDVFVPVDDVIDVWEAPVRSAA